MSTQRLRSKTLETTGKTVIGTMGLAFFLALGVVPPAKAEAAIVEKASAELGQTAVGTGMVVDLSRLPQVSTGANLALPPPAPRKGVSEAEYAKRKAEAMGSFSAAPTNESGLPPAGSTPGILTPSTSVQIPGLQQQGGIAPSDMALAVSGSWVVQAVNSQIAVWSKAGTLQLGFPKSLGGAGGFFPGATADIGDPRAFYDWNRGRFVVVADDFTGGRMWLAASQSSDPRGLWNIYSFAPWGAANCRSSVASCPDFPMVGFDDTTIYLSLNFFPAAGGFSDWVLLLPKSQIYANQGFTYNFWFNLSFGGLVDTVQPVVLQGSSEHPRAGFAINSRNFAFGGGQCSTAPCNGLIVWAFSNNLTTTGSPGPEISAVSVATANDYRLPSNANQPGGAFSIDTGDVRISATPNYHAGLISAALNTNGSDGHSHVLWFQVRPFLNDNNPRCTGTFNNLCPGIIGAQLVNEDCYFCAGQGAAGSTYYGAVQPNDAGDLTMVFVYSDNNIFPESAYVSRRTTLQPNIMHDNGLVLCGNASFWGGGRWGDYSATASDIANAKQNYMWFSAMNSTPGGRWGACIGRNGFTAINQP